MEETHSQATYVATPGGLVVTEFIHEDAVETFEGFLQFQAVDPATLSEPELAEWRSIFDEATARRSTAPKVGRMQLRRLPGEHLYAVAAEERSELWLALWLRRSRKGEVFVMVPRADRSWNPHTSYHVDGTLHMKSYDRAIFPTKRQPLNATFRGTEHLGVLAGYAPRSVGAVCDATAFDGVLVTPPDTLGPRHGWIAVDLVEPGCEPAPPPWSKVVKREVYRDAVPWLVITVGTTDMPRG